MSAVRFLGAASRASNGHPPAAGLCAARGRDGCALLAARRDWQKCTLIMYAPVRDRSVSPAHPRGYVRRPLGGFAAWRLPRRHKCRLVALLALFRRKRCLTALSALHLWAGAGGLSGRADQ